MKHISLTFEAYDMYLYETKRYRDWIDLYMYSGRFPEFEAMPILDELTSWWNPAVENQATDRAFRIGQTKDVQVHKFITLGTIEEPIDEMLERKQSITNQVVDSGEQWITELSTADLKELLALRQTWVTET